MSYIVLEALVDIESSTAPLALIPVNSPPFFRTPDVIRRLKYTPMLKCSLHLHPCLAAW